MELGKGQRPPCIELIDEDVARILRGMSGTKRLRIASEMYRKTRLLLIGYLRHEHPDWDEGQVKREAIRRMSHGAV
jgi:hypothetical protein